MENQKLEEEINTILDKAFYNVDHHLNEFIAEDYNDMVVEGELLNPIGRLDYYLYWKYLGEDTTELIQSGSNKLLESGLIELLVEVKRFIDNNIAKYWKSKFSKGEPNHSWLKDLIYDKQLEKRLASKYLKKIDLSIYREKRTNAPIALNFKEDQIDNVIKIIFNNLSEKFIDCSLPNFKSHFSEGPWSSTITWKAEITQLHRLFIELENNGFYEYNPQSYKELIRNHFNGDFKTSDSAVSSGRTNGTLLKDERKTEFVIKIIDQLKSI